MRYLERKKAEEQLSEIDKKREMYHIIHYSSGNFKNPEEGYSSRITSIAIYNVGSGQTVSFSIHMIAEEYHISFDQIEDNYDFLEEKMLAEYFEFVKIHQESKWLHWNMRDSTFGFTALEHRYKIFGGTPIQINDENKIDVSGLFVRLYGNKYIEHPRMYNIIKLNSQLSMKNFLTGEEEIEAFHNKEFAKMHMSTQRKVLLIMYLLDLAINGNLKTKAKVKDIYGLSARGLYEYTNENVFLIFIKWSITLFVGYMLGKYL